MRRCERAFTLLEVMAAVAVVAIVFTTLARVASEGLRSQGVSKRRFQASLLADELVADLEAEMRVGIVPEHGESESEEGIFTIETLVAAMNLENVFPGFETEEEVAERESEAENASPIPPAWAQVIRITVAWLDGSEWHRVVRYTYGVDYALIATGYPNEEFEDDPTNVPADAGENSIETSQRLTQ